MGGVMCFTVNMFRSIALMFSFIASIFLFASQARASELTFGFNNPSFGGNPFNSAHLLGVANAVNQNTAPPSSATGSSDADLFVRQLQSRLLSGLAAQVTEAIFGDNPQESGTIVFGDQRIEFDRGLEAINLTIFDTAAGTTTTISIPVLQGAAPGAPG